MVKILNKDLDTTGCDAVEFKGKKTKEIIVISVLVLMFFTTVFLCMVTWEKDDVQDVVCANRIEKSKNNRPAPMVKPLKDNTGNINLVTEPPASTNDVVEKDDETTDNEETISPSETVSPTQEPVVIPELEKSDKDNPKRVYLTFDDGPSVNTARILDILKEYDVKATFFVNGKTSQLAKDMYKRIVDEGHTLAMHSYSHNYEDIYKSTKAFSKDVKKLSDYLEEITGVRPKYYRFPGGSSTTKTDVSIKKLIRHLKSQGIKYFDWNVQNSDAQQRVLSKEELIANVVVGVNRHQDSIVLMHDARSKGNTVDSLPQLIEMLLESGAQILPIDDDTPSIVHVDID